MISAHIVVLGHVQGVGFRADVQRLANRLGLSGWVRNLPNGTVEIQVEGLEGQVEEFIEWCHIGPADAVVEEVTVVIGPAEGGTRGFQRR